MMMMMMMMTMTMMMMMTMIMVMMIISPFGELGVWAPSSGVRDYLGCSLDYHLHSKLTGRYPHQSRMFSFSPVLEGHPHQRYILLEFRRRRRRR
jgi:hypothetical protein